MKNIKVKFKFVQLLGALTLTTLLNGCFTPSFTYSKSVVSVQIDHKKILSFDKNIHNRYVIVSFWEYPIFNNSRGKVVIDDVILTNKQRTEVNFHHKGYWTVWTPALGTQHLAPEPGIMIFYENYPLRWSIGGTDLKRKICCEKPETRHNFEFEFVDAEENLLPRQNNNILTRVFIENFLAEKDCLIKKIENSKGITSEEKRIVLKKLDQLKSYL